jgi:anti-sigma regulatory factor (Ser/Thr protein kinase)
MDRIVELEIPARPEFVGIARMAVGALAGIRPGLAYERVDDLRIVVSEACTSAIEGLDEGSVLKLRCVDGAKSLEVRIEAPGSVFEGAVPINEPDDPDADNFRVSLIRALVDDADLKAVPGGTELCLIMHREAVSDEDGGGDLPA